MPNRNDRHFVSFQRYLLYIFQSTQYQIISTFHHFLFTTFFLHHLLQNPHSSSFPPILGEAKQLFGEKSRLWTLAGDWKAAVSPFRLSSLGWPFSPVVVESGTPESATLNLLPEPI